MDIVFTTCSTVGASTGLGKDCSINVAFNQQLRLCSSSTDSETKKGERVCRQPDNLCTADPSFKFDMDERSDNQVRLPLVISNSYSFFNRVSCESLSPLCSPARKPSF